MELFSSNEVKTVGISLGGRVQGDVTVDYVPEAGGDRTAQGFIDAWENTFKDETERINSDTADMMTASRPVLIDIKTAADCVPGLSDRLILHSGPPAEYCRLGEGHRRAVAAAAVFEGWASGPEEAESLLEKGDIRIDSADHHNASATGCGAISPSMPVFRVCDRRTGSYIYAPAAVYGDEKVSDGSCSVKAISSLVFAAENLVPALSKALLSNGSVDIFSVAKEGMSAGDDCCLRTEYCSSAFRNLILKHTVASGENITEEMLDYLGDPRLFLELFTAAVKAMLVPARNREGCSFITSYCSNGRVVGIRIAGKSDRWFTAELGEDAVCGDEIVCELAGAGSACLCTSAAAASGTGLGLFELLRIMYDSYSASDRYIEALVNPYSGYPGTPLFVDFIKMCRTSVPLNALYVRKGVNTVRNIGMQLQMEALRSFVTER